MDEQTPYTSFDEQCVAEIEQIGEAPPQELERLLAGGAPNSPGSNGFTYGAINFAHGMLRDYSMYTIYPVYSALKSGEIGAELITTLFSRLSRPYVEFLNYAGFNTLYDLEQALLDHIRGCDDLNKILISLQHFLRYANQVTAWSHHLYPWPSNCCISELKSPPPFARADSVTRAVESTGKRQVLLRWEPIGISASAHLADKLNPELCEEFWSKLPFKVLQTHAMVTGQSMYAWCPFISDAPIRSVEEVRHAPPGRLRFSQKTGNKLIIQYGNTTENLCVPVLGRISESDLGRIAEVGERTWQAVCSTKELIWLHVSADGDGQLQQ